MKKWIVMLSMVALSTWAQEATVKVTVSEPGKAISPDLFGIFFEDINYAADGGLYAELIQNRSFEYSDARVRHWHALTAWDLIKRYGGEGAVRVGDSGPLHPNNPHYAILTIDQAGSGVGLLNAGFDGITLNAGENYNVSLFARVASGSPEPLVVRLEGRNGALLGEAEFSGLTKDWAQYKATIKSVPGAGDARLVVLASGEGELHLDVISLFPDKTFRNRPNGLRADLAQVIADLKPKFMRFPGGCLVHGYGLDNMYRWKDTVGPIEERKEQFNIWHYHQTMGLGYFEYFQFCEDIGAKPIPVVPAGVCCQNFHRGQQGLPMAEMPDYVQEVIDLVEYANGPATSTWGAKRADAGHPEPFNLEYIGVGNEDKQTPEFRERFKMIYDAMREKHPEITIIGTVGPAPSGGDFDEGWKFANELNIPMVDEHYYLGPGVFLAMLNRYDDYDRDKSKVYLGEYAAHDRDRRNTLRSALAEAAYMTSLERNGDIVPFASYAPMLGKEHHTQWNPNLIYFNNTEILRTANYYAQQLFSVNEGDYYLPTKVELELESWTVNGIMLGAWDTQAQFDDVMLVNQTGTLIEESFDEALPKDWMPLSGRWEAVDGVYCQTSSESPALSRLAFTDDQSGYVLTLRAKKSSGAEGFLIGFGAIDADNYFWWNIGGWRNTRHCIEVAHNGNRSSIGVQTEGHVESNRWYDIKIEVTGERVTCWLDGELIHDFAEDGDPRISSAAASCVRDSGTGDIIFKLVNVSDEAQKTHVDLSGVGDIRTEARKTVLCGDPNAYNTFQSPRNIVPSESDFSVSENFSYEAPPNSLTVIRMKAR
ncbi:alpha-N-arabinofuranosidase [Candidatus Sumerlaeota bacterium]|nr:alpha-N-arabinofuranosidase [Candidatus Sumerlaeota bacterium]